MAGKLRKRVFNKRIFSTFVHLCSRPSGGTFIASEPDGEDREQTHNGQRDTARAKMADRSTVKQVQKVTSFTFNYSNVCRVTNTSQGLIVNFQI